jgi:signal transduction histidine kinase
LYIGFGLALGVAYGAINSLFDLLAHDAPSLDGLDAFHTFVDHGIPLAVGLLLGLVARALQDRARLAHEQARRAEALDARLARVERDQAVWVIAAATLHEVRNPLHALELLFDEAASASLTDEPTRRVRLQRARAHFDRIRDHLAALRTFADRAAPNAKPIALDVIVREIAADLSPLAAEARVDLRVHADGHVNAVADPIFVRVIVENLVTNGFDVAREAPGAAIDVDVRREANDAVVTVRDNGPGIDPSARGAIFEPLKATNDHGLGLGLPIARVLARSMHGDLALEPSDGRSTTFTVRLPLEGTA